jgi:thiopurine S-methyltransferase
LATDYTDYADSDWIHHVRVLRIRAIRVIRGQFSHVDCCGMDREYWLNRWVENRTGFHLKGVNPLLERFWPQVAPSGAGRVLVPLCGKSEDLRWLAERGHDVVGVDLSAIAARAFSSEQGIAFAETQEPHFTVFRGKQITFYVGDFSDFTPDIGGSFDFLYDRAALIALPPAMRPGYARQLQSLLTIQGRGLLISLEYDTSKMEGPPFSVAEPEVRTLFADFPVDKLLEYDCLEDEPRFKERGVRWMKEVVYQLSSLS